MFVFYDLYGTSSRFWAWATICFWKGHDPQVIDFLPECTRCGTIPKEYR